MNQPQFDNPDAEGAARLAQLAAMGTTVIEAMARLHAQRAALRADESDRAAAVFRAQRTADHAAARVAWSPVHDIDWLRRATTPDLAPAWSAAAAWASTDPDAGEALRRAEARLHQLHPEAMAAYHEARARGVDPGQAMQESAEHWAQPRALGAGDDTAAATVSGHRPPSRPPDVVAADAYPYPTRDGVAAAARGEVHVITTAPRTSAHTPSRAAARR